jgi:hypothetical protein
VHPIERLRHVARADGAPADEVVHAAAASLAGFAADPVSLVTAARRLLDGHPANGALWSVCARVVAATDPADEAWRCLDLFVADATVAELSHALPEGAGVVVVGGPHRLLRAFAARGDVRVTAVDLQGDAYGFERTLDRLDVAVTSVDAAGLGAVAAAADLVVLDADAVGPDVALAAPGSWPVAAVAATEGVPVWVVAGWGRTVPPGLWPALGRRAGASGSVEAVPLARVDRLVGPEGPEPVPRGLGRVDAPASAELAR